jgi:H-type lectin domain-containing protein
MVNAYFYSNIATPTTLSGSINNSVTSATVASTTGWPSSFPYIVALDFGTANEELVRVTANAAGTLTIVRAFGGTVATSHSTGATVRHVYNAQDATDFRTHEAAVSGVHGVAGTLVGTTDAQTLTNKTLTAPAISNPTVTGGGSLAGTFTGTPTFSGALTFSGTPVFSAGASLSGTFSGSPTFSGNPTFSGTPVFSGNPSFTGTIQSTQSASTNVSLAAIVTADTFDRFRAYANGDLEWGPGNAARDVKLYRSSANVLKTDDKMLMERASVGDDGLAVKIVGDGGDRFLVDTDSTGAVVWFGSGAGAPDTNLYRESNGVLKTDGGLKVGGAITDTATGMVFKTYQDGTASVTLTAQSFTTQTVTFPIAFASAPRVILTQRGSQSGTSALKVSADSTTTTNFVLRTTDVNGNNQSVTTNVDWFAVSP